MSSIAVAARHLQGTLGQWRSGRRDLSKGSPIGRALTKSGPVSRGAMPRSTGSCRSTAFVLPVVERERRHGKIGVGEIGDNRLDRTELDGGRTVDEDAVFLVGKVAFEVTASTEYDAFGGPTARIRTRPAHERNCIVLAPGFECFESTPGNFMRINLDRFSDQKLVPPGRRAAPIACQSFLGAKIDEFVERGEAAAKRDRGIDTVCHDEIPSCGRPRAHWRGAGPLSRPGSR